MFLYVYALTAALNASGAGLTANGWLFAGGSTKVVRFVVASDDPGNANVFFPSPQTSGYIVMARDTFSISVAETWGTALLEYQSGVLREKCMIASEGGLGDLRPRHGGERLSFGRAFGAAMKEVTGSILFEDFCQELLAKPTVGNSARKVHGEGYEAVFGAGRGALQSYTEVTPWRGSKHTFKRIVCNFIVVAGKS